MSALCQRTRRLSGRAVSNVTSDSACSCGICARRRALSHVCIAWGTRGPEFKSRRPDTKTPCSQGVFCRGSDQPVTGAWPTPGPNGSERSSSCATFCKSGFDALTRRPSDHHSPGRRGGTLPACPTASPCRPCKHGGRGGRGSPGRLPRGGRAGAATDHRVMAPRRSLGSPGISELPWVTALVFNLRHPKQPVLVELPGRQQVGRKEQRTD
jgi:hypothetical protein